MRRSKHRLRKARDVITEHDIVRGDGFKPTTGTLLFSINPYLSAKIRSPRGAFFVVHFDGWSAEPDVPEVGERLIREIVTSIEALTEHSDMACIVPEFDLLLAADARACLTSLAQQAPA